MVDRFSQQFQDYGVIPSANGDFVRFSDYQKLESDLAKEREKAETRKLALDAAVSSSCVLGADLAAARGKVKELAHQKGALIDRADTYYQKLAAAQEKAKELRENLFVSSEAHTETMRNLAAAQAVIEQMRSAWSDAKTKYVELLSREDSEAAKLQAEGDMYGWNFHQGVRGGAVEFHINLTKLIRAITTPTNLDALHEARALECERLAELIWYDMTPKQIADALREEAAAHRARKEGK